LIIAISIAVLVAVALLLDQRWKARCPNCGTSERACFSCARAADKRIRGVE
jgi:hypothetical protein